MSLTTLLRGGEPLFLGIAINQRLDRDALQPMADGTQIKNCGQFVMKPALAADERQQDARLQRVTATAPEATAKRVHPAAHHSRIGLAHAAA